MTSDDRESMQDQVDALSQQVERLTRRAVAADGRADVAEQREAASAAQAEVDREILASLELGEDLAREHVEQLESALRSSRTIGAAVGLVMARDGVDDERALAILKAASSRTNVKLRVLCEEIVKGTRPAL